MEIKLINNKIIEAELSRDLAQINQCFHIIDSTVKKYSHSDDRECDYEVMKSFFKNAIFMLYNFPWNDFHRHDIDYESEVKENV